MLNIFVNIHKTKDLLHNKPKTWELQSRNYAVNSTIDTSIRSYILCIQIEYTFSATDYVGMI